MTIHFNAAEFCVVPDKQKEYFKKVTANYLNGEGKGKKYKSYHRGIFETISGIMFQEMFGYPIDNFERPNYDSMFLILDCSKKDFVLVCQQLIRVQHHLVDIGFGQFCHEEYFAEDPTALFRNVTHLIAVIDCNVRDRGHLYDAC